MNRCVINHDGRRRIWLLLFILVSWCAICWLARMDWHRSGSRRAVKKMMMMMTTGAACVTLGGVVCVCVWLAFVWVRSTRPPAGDVVDLFPSSVLSHFSPLVTGEMCRTLPKVYHHHKDPKRKWERVFSIYGKRHPAGWRPPLSLPA